jgi:predicted GTPase
MPSKAGVTRREENRAIRAEDMRERIRNSGMLTRVIDNIDKMQKLADQWDPEDAQSATQQINALQMTNNQAHKLLDKVLPIQKELAVEGELKIVAIDMIGIHEEAYEEDLEHDG